MTPKERFLTAISGGVPDRLPATTHHLLPYFMDKYMGGMGTDGFFERFGLDPIVWAVYHIFDKSRGEYFDPGQGDVGFLGSRWICSDNWRIERESFTRDSHNFTRYGIVTPMKTLNMTLESNCYTSWVVEHPIKEKEDIEILGRYMPYPLCDVEALNETADRYGGKALIRGHLQSFDIYGQAGCWQDAACLVGIEELIMSTYDDAGWVHELLKILLDRKLVYARSLEGAKYDILELGGGDASSTVISPKLFREFVAPYDSRIIEEAHKAGQKISYHTCGGMMPLLEDIADMGPDAMETFTPVGMGGDTQLAEAKRRIGGRVCMIGGFDQFHFFKDCAEEDVRREVRRCFKDAGGGGGYILCPSDHFFDADIELIEAYSNEAAKCLYG
jgi:uroporphyrinogen decarboxylase